MSNVVARTIFNTTVVERNWKNYVTSGIVHAIIIAAAFLIVVPTVQVLSPPAQEHVTLIAPALPHYHPKIDPPRIRHVAKLVVPAAPPPIVRTVPPPPPPKTIAKSIPPPVIPPAPKPRIVAEAKPDLPPAPKPILKTGSFQDLQAAKAPPVAKQVVVGGFGDPRGVQSSDTSKPSPLLMAKVGSFESPVGAGQSGGSGHLDTGSVKQSGFGSAGDPTGAQNGNGKAMNSVRTGNFGDGAVGGVAGGHGNTGSVKSTGFGDTVAATPQHKDSPAAVPSFTPVEILFKPRPSYSSEARNLHLEGQVSLEVVFQASGAVRVVRVIRGLGHGLDEAAEQAAAQVRFKPAMRSGAPVDQNATISITFELT